MVTTTGGGRGPGGDTPRGETPRAAWRRLLAACRPVYLDVAVLARKLPERSGPSRLFLELTTEDGARLGRAHVFPGEWYPSGGRNAFSHYFLVLQRAFAGLEAEGREARLRLQLLKAVNAGDQYPYVVLLKYVVAPEFAVTGGRLEELYRCPLSAYYQHFLGLGRDVLRDARSPTYAAGQALHRGYQRAAQAWVRTRDAAATLAAYDAAVVRAWADDFAYYLLDRPKRPGRLYTLPIAAGPTLVRRLGERWPDGAVRFYQERLFYSPARGLAGRADRIAERETAVPPLPEGEGTIGPHPSPLPGGEGTRRQLFELKTTGYSADRDPRTGRAAPGGVQALAYHEILRSLDGQAPETYVEVVAPEGVEALPLTTHPVVTRAEADVLAPRDRYLDLFAQARNVAYVVESGLLTGYDRNRIDEIAKYGQRLRGVGGDFNLYGAVPPCRACAVQTRGLCEDARHYAEAPWYDFFRHVPARLYRYWAWFHRQLQAEERAGREHLYHLAATPLARLEAEEGISLADLVVQEHEGLLVRLGRARRIETRLREDDRVLVTPQAVPPGEVHSVEGVVRAVGEDWLALDVRDELAATGPYRVDQLGYWERLGWQLEGLTDFLVGAMFGSGVRGRAVALDELPPLARLILGAAAAGPSNGGGETAAPSAARSLHAGDAAWRPRAGTRPAPTSRVARAPAAANSDGEVAGVPGAGTQTDAEPSSGLRGWGGQTPAASADRGDLNPEQRRALEAALGLAPGELLLIQGPPGTGKTALIARLVRAVVQREFWNEQTRPILLLANTHRACDELVRKLHDQWPDLRPYLVRLGPANAGMEPLVRQYVLAERLRVREQLDGVDLRANGAAAFVRLVRQGVLLHDQAAVFVGTLAGAARPELRGLAFSYVVVDECGQATEPAALQALRHLPRGYAGRLVLVGDHQQLPPVAPEELPAAEVPAELVPAGFQAGDGLRTSLFERLARRYPERLITLREQYRMCAPVCEVVSETFYGGALRPGSVAVAAQRLTAARAAALAAPWDAVWDPAARVVFVDTRDDPAARDTQVRLGADDARDNPREAALLADLLAALFAALPPAEAFHLAERSGVISPYRRQNNRLRQELRARLGPLAERLRVDTVDRFQGGERDLIAMSLVASNAQRSIGPLHADWRRMNVALSRARAKLVVVGDRATFTAPGDAADEPAKARYRELFAALDAQAAAGAARLLPAGLFPPGAFPGR
ncbi:MAG TPA: AAA domain-containing protein [Chloroflexota bacterium]|nr:AAA domain-containing protein [Chloroflexota bacterium]